MQLILTRAKALRAVHTFANEYGIPWVGVARVQTLRAWWLFPPLAYQFDIDAGGQGPAVATVGVPFRGVERFEFRPHDPDRYWLPPWAAFPTYTAGTMGWRQGSGEAYLSDWFRWFNTLPEVRRAAYQARFPEPNRGGWPGFYDRSR